MKTLKGFAYVLFLMSLLVLSGCKKEPSAAVPEETATVAGGAENSATNADSAVTPDSEPALLQIEAEEIAEPSSIDVKAVDTVKDALNQGKDVTYLKQFEIGKELKIEELDQYKFSADETDFLESLKNIDEQEHETGVHLIDIDNDGEEEIAISQYQGGSMGIVYFAVLKKNDGGEYTETVEFNYERGITFSKSNTLSFVRMEKLNYMCLENVDYNTHTFTGVTLYRFADGKYAESAVIELNSKSSYTIEKVTADAEFEEYTNSLDINEAITTTQNCTVMVGSAEKEGSQPGTVTVDVNNDGTEESVVKSYRATSTYNISSYLELKIKSTDDKLNSDPIKTITGETFDSTNSSRVLQQFWCDSSGGSNVVNILYRNDTDGVYSLDTYLLSGDQSKKIGVIMAKPINAVGVKYYRYSLVPAEDSSM